jgi:hypothetical protein
MGKRLALLGTAAFLAALLISSASGLTKPQVFSLLDVSGPQTALPPGSFNPNANAPIPLGGRFAFTDALYKWAGRHRGARAGRLEGLCTATKLDIAARSETIFCNATAYLPAGQILLAGQIIFSERTSAFRVVVIGGTSGYEGARGFAKITNIGVGNNSNIQFHLLP